MGKHRDQAKFDRAEWKLLILLPCWVAQISLLLILLGISAYLLSNAMKDDVEVRGTAIAYVHFSLPKVFSLPNEHKEQRRNNRSREMRN